MQKQRYGSYHFVGESKQVHETPNPKGHLRSDASLLQEVRGGTVSVLSCRDLGRLTWWMWIPRWRLSFSWDPDRIFPATTSLVTTLESIHSLLLQLNSRDPLQY